jgi:hypothetical protein
MRFFKNSIAAFRRIFRLLRVVKKEQIVWSDLLKLMRVNNCNFGHFENEGYIETKFELEGNQDFSFRYFIDEGYLRFGVILINDFDEEDTLDYMVLASHLNNLLDYRKVVVHTDYNVIEFTYYGDLLKYLVDPNELESDISSHIYWAEKCLWAFNQMMETGEDPVFIMAEFMKKLEEPEKAV